MRQPIFGLLENLVGLKEKIDDYGLELMSDLRQTIDGVDIRPPAPVMNMDSVGFLQLNDRGIWKIRTVKPPTIEHYRGFVVDAEYPQGSEITDKLSLSGAALWHLEEPGQRAVVVLFGSTNPILGDSLSEVIDAVEKRNDVGIVTKEFTRPR